MMMPETELLHVLVVDDSVFYQKIVKDMLAELPYVRVAGVAHNGKAALLKIEALRPDLMILDIEMPEMDGLELLARLQAMRATVGAIMLSSYTRQGTLLTIRALELGAFDFIAKPQAGSAEESRTYNGAVSRYLCLMAAPQ
jgi:two-component system chemotaxis response regulator CheB